MTQQNEHPLSILLVDDDTAILESCSQGLRLSGHQVETCTNAADALSLIGKDSPHIVISDIRMPKMDGLELLRKLTEHDDELPVILLTGHGDVDLAVEAMRSGAWDFLQKPVQPRRLIESAERALKQRRLVLENRALHREVAKITLGHKSETRLIGNAPVMVALKDSIDTLAQVDANVLIHGETGAGKEAVARRLHELGPRRDRNYVALNCGAMPLNIIESELFGHEKGAFTGADSRRIGRLEHANGGTIFLDEIESMPMDVQIKFLRVLQDRVIEPIGGNRTVPLDVRVVAAAKTDLFELSKQGKFRDDLYFRLHVAELNIPPLRERKEDIPLLFRYFVERSAQQFNRPVPLIDATKDQELIDHSWPGNVRELMSAAERHVLGLASVGRPQESQPEMGEARSLRERMESFEKSILVKALEAHNGSMQQTAEELSIPYKTLYLRLKKYGIDKRAPS